LRTLFIIGFFLTGLILSSCQKEESYSEEEQKTMLMSTGWKMESVIFHFLDGRDPVDADSLILITTWSDETEEVLSVYTGRWIVFENDSIALSAFNFDFYSRPGHDNDWKLEGRDLTGVGGTDWGFDAQGNPHLGLLNDRPILIRLLNTDRFILKDAYRIETTEPLVYGSGTVTYLFGNYPSGTLKSIDVVYRAAGADEGPDWFPPWRYWPE